MSLRRISVSSCCRLSLFILLATACINSGSASFTETPTDQEPVEGRPFTVNCSAEDTLFLLWYKEGRAIGQDNPHYQQTSSGDGGRITLSVEAASHTEHTGSYECVAVYLDSSMKRAVFTISVQYIDLEVGIQLEVSGPNCSHGAIVSGCHLSLLCLPPRGYPDDITVSWLRNSLILQVDTAGVKFSEDNTVLMIGGASFDDSGCYQCTASNGIGIVRQSERVRVVVQEPGRGLRFVEGSGPSSDYEAVSVEEGATLRLSCAVEDSVGTVQFQWLFQSREEDQEMVAGERVSISLADDSSTLLLHEAAVEDEGLFVCVAADCLTCIKRNFTVSVNVPRAIVQWPLPEVLGTEGDRAQFDCVTTGQPQPVVIWFFQSTPVPKLPTSGAHDLGNGSLVIPVLQPHHSGTYFCMLREPPLDIHTFSLTVEARRRPRPSPAAPASPNIPLSTSPAQNTSSHSTHFTIGPFSEVVSIVVVCVGGLSLLVLGSALILSVVLCCCKSNSKQQRRKRRRKCLEISDRNGGCVPHSIPAESYLLTSYSARVLDNGAIRPRERSLPLPPEPDIDLTAADTHYEELGEVTADVTSGVGRPRLPTFSSDTSETVGTELETITSAATDTHLV